MSSAYLRLLIFLPAILIPACASSSPTFLMMYSACKLNEQGENIQPLRTPFPVIIIIYNQSQSVSLSVKSDSLWPHELCILPGSSTHGIFQAGILEWVLGSFNGPKPGGMESMIRKWKKEADIPWFTQRTNKVLDTGLASLTKAPGALSRGS